MLSRYNMDTITTSSMTLTKQELLEVMACVRYYQNRHLALRNPRHEEFEVILEKLNKSLQSHYDRND